MRPRASSMPVADAVSLTMIAGIFDQTQSGIFRSERLHDFSGVVARAIVDDDDFGIPALLMHVGENLLEEAPRRALSL